MYYWKIIVFCVGVLIGAFFSSSHALSVDDLIIGESLKPYFYYNSEDSTIKACWMYPDETAGYCTPDLPIKYLDFCLTNPSEETTKFVACMPYGKDI